ncbi:MAG: cation:proton antiporter [Candidatus Electrothrix sp.]
MSHDILLQLTGIFILGIISQWTAWKLHLPSILFLLIAGLIVGPGLGLLHPDQLFGELLFPMVSLAVAVILYEGGMNLRFRELSKQKIRGVLLQILTLAVLISLVLGTVAAHYIIGFSWPVATLLAAILVVTGPTVIGPMLRHLRLRGRVSSLLKWEGIVVDPLGATLAVLVFTVVRHSRLRDGLAEALFDFWVTFAVGVSFGFIAAAVLIVMLRRFWLPDALHNPVSLMLMFASFAAANVVQDEAGLLAVTVMGITLANQKWVSIRHVIEFKETLTTLLISCLFVVLAARLQPEDIRGLGWDSVLFVAFMIVVVRPVSILAATIGSSLPWRERLFMSWMAPRGIVAAAVASVFALELAAKGYPQAVELVPVTFLMVFATVLIYGLSAVPLSRRFGLARANPQGILFIGAHKWARAMAQALMNEGFSVVLIDTDRENIALSRMAGMPAIYGSALAKKTREEIDYGGLGRMLAMTANNAINALTCLHFLEDFGRQEVYQLSLPPVEQDSRHEAIPQEQHGRLLFGEGLDFFRLNDVFGRDPKIKLTKLTKEFDYQAFTSEYGETAIVLFILKPNRSIEVCTVDSPADPVAGDVLISIIQQTQQSLVPIQALYSDEGQVLF